jgi:hypothetical protein
VALSATIVIPDPLRIRRQAHSPVEGEPDTRCPTTRLIPRNGPGSHTGSSIPPFGESTAFESLIDSAFGLVVPENNGYSCGDMLISLGPR